MSRVLVDGLKVRPEPSVKSDPLITYGINEIIKTGEQLIQNEGRIWLR